MKWIYNITTDAHKQKILGLHYGSFEEAVDQVAKAVRAEGWGKNTTPVTIVLTPQDKE